MKYRHSILKGYIFTMVFSLFVCCISKSIAEAISEFQQALKDYQRGDMKSALPLFLKLTMTYKKNDPLCHYYLANVLMRLNRSEEAKAEYKQVLFLNSDVSLFIECNKILNDNFAIVGQEDKVTQSNNIVDRSINNGFIGIKLTGNLINKVFPGSPADKVGLKKGDRIFAINDKSTTGWTGMQIAEKLIGPIGTSVTIDIHHQSRHHKLVLVRAKPTEEFSKQLIEHEKRPQ